MMKNRIALLLVAMLLLPGCQTNGGQSVEADATEPTVTYDWMAGESPISPQRTGLERPGLTHADMEVTANGVYFIYDHPYMSLGKTAASPVILYADHDSDTVIKLCGRADCTHQTQDCNAYIQEGSLLTYYGGYLYALTQDSNGEEDNTLASCKLIRMDLDGSNRVEILDVMKYAKENGYTSVSNSLITDGVCLFGMTRHEEQPDGSTLQIVESFCYPLDGSQAEPWDVGVKGWQLYSCGDVLLTYGDAQNGGEYGGYYDWDPVTGDMTFLTDHPGAPGYFGAEEAYYFKDGAVRRLTYATQEEEILIETGLEGDYYALFFPDCIVVASDAVDDTSDRNLYIYNWTYKLVDTVEITYPCDLLMTANAIIAETAQRFILTDHLTNMPRYYIEKSELGTGNVKLHKFKLPDMDQELQYHEEEIEDTEWLENG